MYWFEVIREKGKPPVFKPHQILAGLEPVSEHSS